MAGKIAVADFVCPEMLDRVDPDFTVWMDTIEASRYEDA